MHRTSVAAFEKLIGFGFTLEIYCMQFLLGFDTGFSTPFLQRSFLGKANPFVTE